MHEIQKLEESKYFYSEMVSQQNNKDKFIYNLSAFLSAARSVLQYALEEANIKNGGKNWYDNQVSKNDILKFFKDQRDINIHAEPINPQANHNITISTTSHGSASISFTAFDKDGNIKQQYNSIESKEELTEEAVDSGNMVHEVRYAFTDWTGSEDVLLLCQNYIKELEKVVQDGISKGFITG